MPSYSLTHLSDPVLVRDLVALVARERATVAELLAHLAEVDARRLYLPAAYPSMYAWCVGVLKLSEDSAFKRIRAARTVREFPAIFAMLADGRLNLSSLLLLAPHLAPATAGELLEAAAGKTNGEIEQLLAERFPRPDVPTLVFGVTTAGPCTKVIERQAEQLAARPVCASNHELAAGRVHCSSDRTKVALLSPGRFALQVTVAQETHDKLRYAQALLGHVVPSGDLAQVLDRALDSLIAQLEQRRFARTARSRPSRRSHGENSRQIPAQVRRLVWERDGGRCTFTSESGHRCEARARLEFDHIEAFARGGESTPAGLRLRCRAHNQYTAEHTFGTDFMRHKREQVRCRAAEEREASRERAAIESRARQATQATDHEREAVLAKERERADALRARRQEVIPWLRQLHFRPDEAQRAVMRCELDVDAPLETWVHAALVQLAPPSARKVPSKPGAAA